MAILFGALIILGSLAVFAAVYALIEADRSGSAVGLLVLLFAGSFYLGLNVSGLFHISTVILGLVAFVLLVNQVVHGDMRF